MSASTPEKKQHVKLPQFTNDEYNIFVGHIKQCKNPDCLVTHYLVLTFNPLIVGIAKSFRGVWTSEFSELIYLTRARFIRQLHRYEVGGRIYFRYFMARAVFYDVRDCIHKDRRGQGLVTWNDNKIEELPEQNLGYWIRDSAPHQELGDRLDVAQIMKWINSAEQLTDLQRTVFMAHLQGWNDRDIKKILHTPPAQNIQDIIEEVRNLVKQQFPEFS